MLLEELHAESAGINLPAEGTPSHNQARKAVEQFFEQLHHPLRSERDRLEAKATELAARQEQFRQDRIELEKWFSEQELALADKLSKDHSAQDEARIAALEEQLSDMRQRWHKERREAEETIRDLLNQVTQAESSSFVAAQSTAVTPEDDHRHAA